MAYAIVGLMPWLFREDDFGDLRGQISSSEGCEGGGNTEEGILELRGLYGFWVVEIGNCGKMRKIVIVDTRVNSCEITFRGGCYENDQKNSVKYFY